jgi:DNA invertase Pin-like site-specific DNA recombinase
MHGVYVRVSSFSQNVAGQKREIEQWLKACCGKDVKVRWYIDKATGNNLRRPAFERLQSDIFKGDVDTVVVWKLDRLSRNLRDGITTLCDWCPEPSSVLECSRVGLGRVR